MKRYIVLLIITVLSVYNLNAQNIECIGNTIEIPLIGSRNESVQWQFSANEVDWVNLPGAKADTLVYPIIETGYFRASVIYGGCEYYSDTTYIEAYPVPTIANAGTDQNKSNADSTVNLSANSPSFGAGKWTVVSGITGSFANDTIPATTFTGSQCCDYVLRWTISTACNNSSDDVNIGFHAEPTIAMAGTDQNITNGIEIVTLNANVPMVGTGFWTRKEGGYWENHFEDPTVSNTTFFGYNGFKYILTWTISTACNSSADDVNINLYDPLRIVLDYDGNIYNTLTIGNRVWINENLKTTKYNDGTEIPLVIDSTSWNNLSTPGYCWYNNNEATYKPAFGALYNWYAVNTGKLCPPGWNVSSDADWTELTNYFGGDSTAGGRLKESGAGQWQSPNSGATNESEFSALPGGKRAAIGSFSETGYKGYWWGSTESSDSSAWNRGLTYSDGIVYRNDEDKRLGFSVRCEKIYQLPTVTTDSASDISLTSATCGGNVTFDGGASISARGVCWSTSPNPTTADNITIDNAPDGNTGGFSSFMSGLKVSTIYYVRAYATNSLGTGYGNGISFTTILTDADGNVYNTVTIGTQTWMAENLKTTRYLNGDLIDTTSPATVDLTGTLAPKYQWAYGGFESNVATYGRLYTWFSVTDCRKICPSDFHLPSDAEWTTLTTYLGGDSVAGGKLIEGGFKALPGGERWVEGDFNWLGYSGKWWSSTLYRPIIAWCRYIRFTENKIERQIGNPRGNGHSVRCLKDSVASSIPFAIGCNYQGGILAYILQPGDPGYDANVPHGLIAAPCNQSTGIPWSNGNYTATGATTTALGTGNANTNAIVTNQGAGNYAAKLCYDLELGGYNDWYLPSKDELNKLFLNQAAIYSFVFSNYWSSSERIDDLFFNALCQDFYDGYQGSGGEDSMFYVRAVRSF